MQSFATDVIGISGSCATQPLIRMEVFWELGAWTFLWMSSQAWLILWTQQCNQETRQKQLTLQKWSSQQQMLIFRMLVLVHYVQAPPSPQIWGCALKQTPKVPSKTVHVAMPAALIHIPILNPKTLPLLSVWVVWFLQPSFVSFSIVTVDSESHPLWMYFLGLVTLHNRVAKKQRPGVLKRNLEIWLCTLRFDIGRTRGLLLN